MNAENTEGELAAPVESDAETANETTEEESQQDQVAEETEGEASEGGEVADDAAKPTEEAKAEEEDEEPETESKSQRKRRLRKERAQRVQDELEREKRRVEALTKRIDALKDTDPNASDNYDEAVAQNTVNRTIRAQTEAEREDAAARALEIEEESKKVRADAWNERVAEAKHIRDFSDKVYDQTVPFTDQIVSAVQDLDAGPDVAYHLATHQEELRRLHRLTPVQLGVELGKIEASISTPKPKLKSTAPTPLNTIQETTTEPDFNAETATYQEYRKRMGFD